MRGIFVTGIGTDVGKTIASAIFTEATGGVYWKPIQCGSLERTDSDTVASLTMPPASTLPTRYRFSRPISPHAAAAAEGVAIDLDQLRPPHLDRPMVVEGAGGILVPLNGQHLMVHFAQQLNLPVVLVSRHYLGSINHTLLTISALRSTKLKVIGIVFVGQEDLTTEDAIQRFSDFPILGRIPQVDIIDRSFIVNQSKSRWIHELCRS